MSYEADGLPPGLWVDPLTGQIAGTVESAAPPGDYAVTVGVWDSVAATTQSFVWQVTALPGPTVADPADQYGTEGDTVSLQVVATPPGTEPLQYVAAGLPDGLAIDLDTGLISGILAGGTAGDWQVTLGVFEGIALSERTFTWSVQPYVTLTPVADRTSGEGQTVAVQLAASAVAGPIRYTAEGLPDGLNCDPDTGLITGILAAGTSRPGAWDVWLTATAGGLSTTATFTWTVTRSGNQAASLTGPGDQSASTGDCVSLPIGAADADADVLTWSAYGLPPGLVIDASGVICGEVADEAVRPDPYQVTVHADDGHGGTAAVSFT